MTAKSCFRRCLCSSNAWQCQGLTSASIESPTHLTLGLNTGDPSVIYFHAQNTNSASFSALQNLPSSSPACSHRNLLRSSSPGATSAISKPQIHAIQFPNFSNLTSDLVPNSVAFPDMLLRIACSHSAAWLCDAFRPPKSEAEASSRISPPPSRLSTSWIVHFSKIPHWIFSELSSPTDIRCRSRSLLSAQASPKAAQWTLEQLNQTMRTVFVLCLSTAQIMECNKVTGGCHSQVKRDSSH